MEYENNNTIFVIMIASEDQKLKTKISSKLYKTRIELRIKQSDLQAEGIISQSHLSKIENAEISISAIMLYRLAKRYGKTVEYFFEETNTH